MLLLPGAIIALIGLHLYLVVRLGVTSPPWSREAAGREREEVARPAGSGLVRPSARGVAGRPED
jgi:quinol-cytochrome oxidoreductase complex cytochrome b subunit